jgi:prepilin-type N-terminal cleavage/methylation domain-containing protein
MILDRRGLTLPEILAAVAVIGIGLAGLAAVVPVSSYGLQEGRQLSTATFLAEQRFEEARRAAWAAVLDEDCLGVSAGNTAPTSTRCRRPGSTIATACATGTPCTTFPDEPAVAGAGGYARTTRVLDCAVAPGCGMAPYTVHDAALRQVTVTVSYVSFPGAGGPTGGKSAQISWLSTRR